MKALGEIGWRRAARFGFYTLAMLPYRVALVPQLRAPWLRLLGARVGGCVEVTDRPAHEKVSDRASDEIAAPARSPEG